jgi:hypothetical protein
MYYLLFFLFCLYWVRHHIFIGVLNSGIIRRIQWTHRAKIHVIVLTPTSTAKMSRNRNICPTVLLKHFWLDDKLCNTDSFQISKLSLLLGEKIVPHFFIAMFKQNVGKFKFSRT